MNIEAAQADMRHAYFDGATGIMTSGLVWLEAAVVAWMLSLREARRQPGSQPRPM